MNDDFLWDGRGDGGEDARLAASLSTLRFRPGPTPLPRRRAPRPWRARVSLALAASLIAVIGVNAIGRRAPGSVPVSATAGAPTIDARPLSRTLAIGRWLETDTVSSARVELPSLGHVDVLPGSRLRVLTLARGERRLELAHGAISAIVDAPPRLFVVDTPSATAFDLGCAYTLESDAAGRGTLRVRSGWVSLEWHGHAVRVLEGTSSRLDPAHGASIPLRDDAPPEVAAAARALDDGRDESAALVAEARLEDAVTLWNALPRVDGAGRARIEARLRELVPPPAAVTREAALRLDAAALDAWIEAVRDADHAPPHDEE